MNKKEVDETFESLIRILDKLADATEKMAKVLKQHEDRIKKLEGK